MLVYLIFNIYLFRIEIIKMYENNVKDFLSLKYDNTFHINHNTNQNSNTKRTLDELSDTDIIIIAIVVPVVVIIAVVILIFYFRKKKADEKKRKKEEEEKQKNFEYQEKLKKDLELRNLQSSELNKISKLLLILIIIII